MQTLIHQHLRFSLCRFAAALAVAFPLSIQTRETAADLIVSNLQNVVGEVSVFDINSGANGQDAANSFTTGAAPINVDSVSLFMGTSNSVNGSGFFQVLLYSDAGGLPGSDLGVTFNGNTDPSPGWNLYTPQSPLVVSPNTTYWLVGTAFPRGEPGKIHSWKATNDLSESGGFGWGIGTLVTRTLANGVPGDWTPDNANALVLSVQGSEAAAPEPSAILLSALAGIAFIPWRWKRKGRTVQIGREKSAS